MPGCQRGSPRFSQVTPGLIKRFLDPAWKSQPAQSGPEVLILSVASLSRLVVVDSPGLSPHVLLRSGPGVSSLSWRK